MSTISVNNSLHTNVLTTRATHKNRSSNEDVTQKSSKSSSFLTGWTAKALASFALFLPIPSIVEAANNPQREKAVSGLAEESWTQLKALLDQGKSLKDMSNSNILWNNLQVVFHVTDNTMVEALDPIRMQIIDIGAKNPEVPPQVVHGALYTTAILAKSMNLEIENKNKEKGSLQKELDVLNKTSEELIKAKSSLPKELQAQKVDLETKIAQLDKETKALETRREKLSSHIVPYIGKVIVDTKTKEGLQQRHLVLPSEVNSLKEAYLIVEPYKAKDFDRIASFGIGQIGEKNTLDKAAQELLSSGNNTNRRDMFFDIFMYTNPSVGLPESVRNKAREWIYGRDQLKAHANKGTVPTTTPVMPTVPIVPMTPTSAPNPSPTPPATPAPPTIPGAPPGARTGTIEVLKEINPKLVSPVLPYQFSKDASTQEFVAKNILLLTQKGDEFSLPASAQWFATKSFNDDKNSEMASDYIVLQALAMHAKKDKDAFEVLERVNASFPNTFARAFLAGSMFLDDSPQRRAGLEIINVLNSNPEAARKLITAMADRSAKLIWPEPTSEQDVKAISAKRDKAHRVALLIMAFVDNSHSFVPYLRGIAQNSLTTVDDRFTATIGVALAKDKESIESLLSIGTDETQDKELRELALIAALYIDTPDLVPDSIRKKAASESPFSQTKLKQFFPNLVRRAGDTSSHDLDIEKDILSVNPFHSRISSLYNSWLDKQQKINEIEAQKGSEPRTITEADKVSMLLQTIRHEFGGSSGVLSNKASDQAFNSKYIKPMVKFLESHNNTGNPIDINLAIPMMDILARSNATEATPVLANIAAYPEKYAQDNNSQGFFGVLFNNFAISIMKAIAIEDLGGTVDLRNADDPGAKVLHRVALKDSSRMYRWASEVGLRTLAERYNSELQMLSDPHVKPDAEVVKKLQAVRAEHGKQVLETMKYHAQGLESVTQIRLVSMVNEFDQAKIADMFGVRKELVTTAIETAKKDPKAQVIRSIMHALISNGCKVENLRTLGLDQESTKVAEALFQQMNKQEYWLGNAINHKYTGKGAEVAIVDGGYVYPVDIMPGLKDKIIYPEKLIRWSDLTEFLDLHPTMVASTFHKIAPDPKIRSYSFIASIPEVPFRPFQTQDSAMFALEDLAQLQLTGEANVDVVNYSWGYLNFILSNEELRSEIIDLTSAFMEVLSRMDVKHTVAAGNEHGGFPAFARYGSIAENNSLGLRMDKNNKFTKPDSVFMASAMDGYAGGLAEFTSKQDPLRVAEAISTLAFQGVHVIVPSVLDGKWALEPVNGTSFAAPSNMGILAWGIEARKQAGLPSLKASEWQEVLLKSSKSFPNREPYEGGNYIDVTNFLTEVVKFKPNQEVKPVVANKP